MPKRTLLLVVSTVLMVLAFLLELGSKLWVRASEAARPGVGISGTAMLDVLLVLTMVLMLLVELGVPARVMGRVQGVATVIVSFLTILASFIMLIATIVLLLLMIGLLVATPFGTIVYLAVWGDFSRGGAAATLGLVMVLKLVGAFCLVLYTLQVLKSKSLVLLFACSILLTLVLSFLHGLVPIILVSITDAVGAIVALIVALIWGIYYLISGIISVVKILRVDKLDGAAAVI
jgi:hypothetical protein